MKNKFILLSAGVLIVALGTATYFRVTREKLYPERYLRVIAPIWKRNEPTVIQVKLKNDAWLTQYAGTGLLITYQGPHDNKLGTDRFSYPYPIEPGEEISIPVQVHPDIYPLQETTMVSIRLEWTAAFDGNAMTRH